MISNASFLDWANKNRFSILNVIIHLTPLFVLSFLLEKMLVDERVIINYHHLEYNTMVTIAVLYVLGCAAMCVPIIGNSLIVFSVLLMSPIIIRELVDR